nr:reverse transcriptase domain-containing protein [Tanacetum cinerariifolium]
MQTRSSSKLSRDQTSNPTSSTNPTPKGQIRRSFKQKVENFNFEEHLTPVATMTDNRTMDEMLRAPTEGCAEAIVVPPILAEQFELKHSLINMMTSKQFFGLEKDNPHDHIRWFNKITSTIKYKDVPNSVIKLILFPFSLVGVARRWLKKEPSRSITTWDDLVSKFINEFFPPSRTTNLRNEISNFQQKSDESFHEAWKRYKYLLRACPHYGFTELHQLDTFYNALNPADQDSLNAAAGGAHPYYQCLAAGGNTFLEFRDNIQGYVSAATCNYNQGNPGYRPQGVVNQMRPPGSGSLLGNTVANPKGELKAITTRSGLVTDGPTVPTPPKSVTPEDDECVEETYTDPDLAEYTIKVPPSSSTKTKASGSKTLYFAFKGLSSSEYPALVLMPKYKKMLKALLSNKEKLQELANTPLNENCSAVILQKLPEKLGDPGKFLILCGFSELKCKAVADLGASINLMPLSVWKKLGLSDLIPNRITLELANRAICTPDGIARDVFVPVGKFTFPADFIVVDYESDPRVPLILGRPFLRTARALIDVHGEEMILHDGDERLTLNMKHDTTSYSNHPHRESVNLINIFNILSEDCLEVSVSNKQSGNPTFSLHKEIASPEVTHKIHDSEGCKFLSEELPDIDSFNDIHPHFNDNPLSGSTTFPSNSLLEEFTDELSLVTYPLDYDDNLKCDIESDLREIEFLLYQGEDYDLKDSIDQTDLANLDDYFVDPTPEMFNDEHAPDYSFPLRFDVYPDDFLEIESDADNFYDDIFDSKGEKIKESELLIDELDLPCDILPYSEYDSFASQDFSRDDDLPSPNNEDKVFNPEILIHEKSVTIITRVAQEKKLAISYASLLYEDFDLLFYEPILFKDVPNSMRLLPFSSENEEKVFKSRIYTSEKLSSVPENMKTLANGFCTQVFISSV